jgi:hypothetical protein
MVAFKNDFYTLTPSFKVRILIPLPRGKEHLIEMLFFSSIEEIRIRRILIMSVANNKVLGYLLCKSSICVTGQVLIPLPKADS